MPHFSQHRTFAPATESPADIAAYTHTTLTRWGLPAPQVELLTARVRTLATLLIACSATEVRLHLLWADDRVRVEIATPAMVLCHRLPAWQGRPGQAHTRYATQVDSQARTSEDTEPAPPLAQDLRSA
ncbi:hypothetical protein [Nocardiopsis alborubida]|uniref:Uncharacterized protein n=1 Tax=Nocardiopsis alborubida TaxID=146802 RepID=A0A7X6M8P0_9ACTN|nr:hypothetical protein [Nocardiopsis alborubida]NKY96753.1 hypothetical protein [Nocardiopsis alborubida]